MSIDTELRDAAATIADKILCAEIYDLNKDGSWALGLYDMAEAMGGIVLEHLRPLLQKRDLEIEELEKLRDNAWKLLAEQNDTIAAARKDSERVDGIAFDLVRAVNGWYFRTSLNHATLQGPFETVREAIDTARAAEEKA